MSPVLATVKTPQPCAMPSCTCPTYRSPLFHVKVARPLTLSPMNSPSITFPMGCFQVLATDTNPFLCEPFKTGCCLPVGGSALSPLSAPSDCLLPTELTTLLFALRPDTRVSLRRLLSLALSSLAKPIVAETTLALSRYGKLANTGATFWIATAGAPSLVAAAEAAAEICPRRPSSLLSAGTAKAKEVPPRADGTAFPYMCVLLLVLKQMNVSPSGESAPTTSVMREPPGSPKVLDRAELAAG